MWLLGFWVWSSCLFPFSALCLARQWIHVCRQSTGRSLFLLQFDWEDHLSVKHLNVEGCLYLVCCCTCRCALFLFAAKQERNYSKSYVRRVSFTDDCDVLSPEWLKVVFCVVSVFNVSAIHVFIMDDGDELIPVVVRWRRGFGGFL